MKTRKLLQKTFYFYISFTALIFLAGGITFYSFTKRFIFKQIDEGLTTEKEIIADEVESVDTIPDYNSRFGHQIIVQEFDHPLVPLFQIKDTLIEDENFRYLKFFGNKNKVTGYSVEIYHPLSDTKYLLRNIVLAILFMLAALFVAITGINYFISRKIWSPFYQTIRRLNRYNIMEKEAITFPETTTYEFEILNRVIGEMSEKIRKDYLNMKEFTENASHEIQTPLAIIKTKIEVMLESIKLEPVQAEALQTIYFAVSRLSKLNSGLILLTKIDNNQFPETSDVNINKLVELLLENMADFIEMKELSIEKEIETPLSFHMNPVLSEILINNLLSNAIKHNLNKGFISITITPHALIIRNSGNQLTVKESELFYRFKKDQANTQSLGLGLAIVKKICDFSRIQISYVNHESVHQIEISQPEISDSKLM